MYPGTRIKWIDQTGIDSIQEIAEVDYTPLFCTAAAFAKGPEKWTLVSGQDFFNLYGTPSFDRFGQANIQAAECIKAGAELLVKRITASNATLANLSIYAKVDIGDDEVVNITYIGRSFEDYMSDDVTGLIGLAEAECDTLASENSDSDIFLLYIFADNGRCESGKRIRMECNYNLSKTSSYPIYRFVITDNGSTLGSYSYTLDPTQMADGENISLGGVIEHQCDFINIYQNDDGVSSFIDTIKTATGITSLSGYDIMFGKNAYGVDWSKINVITDADDCINPSSSIGLKLENGTNGYFGDDPMSENPITIVRTDGVSIETTPYEQYITLLNEAFGGVYDTCIFDLDRYKYEVIFDANYPDSVKETICKLVNHREDFFFFRDIGIGKDSVDDIKYAVTVALETGADSKFVGLYAQDYCIYDPYTRKRIRVTPTYTISKKLVSLLNRGHALVVAGIQNGMIIDDMIDGTLNFIPVITPEVNQKEQLDDLRVNYIAYCNDQMVLQTEYTSQSKLTQLSYINNILMTQQVIRAIRTLCPVNRYTFMTGDELEQYKNDVNEVIEEYRSNFNSIEFEYATDSAYASSKIFYGVIRVSFKDFIQSEYFEVIAINAESIAEDVEDESDYS